MRINAYALAALLLRVAPLFSQSGPDPALVKGQLHWFHLSETKQQVADSLGKPVISSDFGADFSSWQYQIGPGDHDDFSHYLVFRKSTGKLVSVTRNFDEPRNVDNLFPEAETSVHHFPNAAKPEFSVRLRRLSGGRVLLAMGSPKPGVPAGQIVLTLESELKYFHGWLATQLKAEAK